MSSEIETLHRPFSKYLREQGIEFINARPDRQSTISLGWPDYTLLSPNSPCLLIEFKAKDSGKLSAKQKELGLRLKERGFVVHLVRDLAVAIELVQAWRSGGFGPTQTMISNQHPEHALYVCNISGNGDHVFRNGKCLRRATIDDIKTLPRK